MSELENKLKRGCSVFYGENTRSEEVGFFIYKNYIVSVYKLFPIIEDKDNGSFENVYAIYDINNDEVFDEYTQSKKDLFEELPGIDGVLFNYSFDSREIVEKSRKVIKEAILKYYNGEELSENYIGALNKIYDFIDESSKDFYEFFIKSIME